MAGRKSIVMIMIKWPQVLKQKFSLKYIYSAFKLTDLFPRSAAGDAGAACHGDAGGLPPGPRAGAGDQQGGQPGAITFYRAVN